MTRDELVSGLKKRLVDDALSRYSAAVVLGEAPGGVAAFDSATYEFLDQINSTQKKMLLGIIRQVAIDTVADVLAFLDGLYWVEGQTDDVDAHWTRQPHDKI